MWVSLWLLLLFVILLVLNDTHLSVTQAFHMVRVMPRISITTSFTTGSTYSKSSTKTRKSDTKNSMILQAHHDRHKDDHSSFPSIPTTRRNLMNHAKNAVLMAAGAATSWTRTNHAYATAVINTSSTSSVPLDKDTLETGLLESRVLENLLSPPTYGMEASDVYYPDYFNGVWQVKSYTKSIQAPCGILLFGGNVTYTKALEEIHAPPLSYKARFIPSSNTYTTTDATANIASIADREYNVKEIANAAMGYNSVLDVILSPSSSTLKSSSSSSSSSTNSMPSPNKISVVLAPKGSNQIVQADLITLARRYETINPLEFHASEVVRQIVAPIQNNNNIGIPSSTTTQKNTSSSSTLLKEIETISLYKAEPNVKTGIIDKITCVQRSATFLLPSQQDPMAYKMWEATRGRPIDVRFYHVEYTKV